MSYLFAYLPSVFFPSQFSLLLTCGLVLPSVFFPLHPSFFASMLYLLHTICFLPSTPPLHHCLHFTRPQLILYLFCYLGLSVTHRLVSLCVCISLCVFVLFKQACFFVCWISFCGCVKCAAWLLMLL